MEIFTKKRLFFIGSDFRDAQPPGIVTWRLLIFSWISPRKWYYFGMLIWGLDTIDLWKKPKLENLMLLSLDADPVSQVITDPDGDPKLYWHTFWPKVVQAVGSAHKKKLEKDAATWIWNFTNLPPVLYGVGIRHGFVPTVPTYRYRYLLSQWVSEKKNTYFRLQTATMRSRV